MRGPAVYAWATLATLAAYRPARLRLVSDGERLGQTRTESVRGTEDRAALPVVRADPMH